VGAAIACGSQKWNGNCALLVKAPSSTSTSATSYSAWARIRSPEASTTSSLKLPTMWPDQQHAGQQAQAAGAGDGQRHARALARIGPTSRCQ
jgi:hypothetical protein